MFTAETLRRVLSYDADTGEFRWLACRKAYLNGRVAGVLNTSGYQVITVAQVHYYGHRLAWLYMTGEWPDHEVDHRDLDKSNNAWTNLRAAKHAQNAQNGPLRNTNTSGIKGVYFNKRQQQWHASITVNGKSHHLGYFDDLDEAGAAYATASNDYHQEFGRLA